MSHTNIKSFLEISNDALRELKALFEDSADDDPVIVFYFTNPQLDALQLDPQKISEDDVAGVRRVTQSQGFLATSKVHVETAPRSRFPDGGIVDIGGVPVNAQRLPADESVGPQMRLSYSDGAFHLAVINDCADSADGSVNG